VRRLQRQRRPPCPALPPGERGRFERVSLRTLGKKGYDFFRRRAADLRKDHGRLLSKPTFAGAQEIARELSALFLSREVDAVWLVYNEFVSPVTQRVSLTELLPIVPPAAVAEERLPFFRPVDFLFEPDEARLLGALLPRVLAQRVWQAMLESAAAEQAARMSAMESATTNASDMIGKLTLQYNRSRQAAITKELMEVVSGAEALK